MDVFHTLCPVVFYYSGSVMGMRYSIQARPGFPETAVEDEVLALWHLPQQTQAQLICEQTQTGNTNYSRGDLFIPSP